MFNEGVINVWIYIYSWIEPSLDCSTTAAAVEMKTFKITALLSIIRTEKAEEYSVKITALLDVNEFIYAGKKM